MNELFNRARRSVNDKWPWITIVNCKTGQMHDD